MRENGNTREKKEENRVKTNLAAAKLPFKTIFAGGEKFPPRRDLILAGGESALAGGDRIFFFFTCKTNK